MAEVKVRHEMSCDPETYWNKCVFDDEYNRRLYLEVLKFPNWKVVDQKDDGKTLTRRVQVDPPAGNIPAAVKKVIGDSLSYTEEGAFDRASGRYTFKATPSAMGDKAKITGEMTCEKLGDKKMARIAKIKVEVKVFMVGSLIEDRILADLKASYARAAEFTNTYVKEKGY